MFPCAKKLNLSSVQAQGIISRPAASTRKQRIGSFFVHALRSDATVDPDAAAIFKSATQGSLSRLSSSKSNKKVEVDADADFITKLKAAWRIFFPERERPLSPKDEGKKRLRMILVADRCGMSTDSLVGMRESIVKAMSDYVEVEAEEAVEVNLSMDPEIGTIYSVAVPVRRVKPSMRQPFGAEGGDDSPTMWNPDDPESDPSDQFPYGT